MLLGQGMSKIEDELKKGLKCQQSERINAQTCLYWQICICQLLHEAQGPFLGQGLIGSTAQGPSAVA